MSACARAALPEGCRPIPREHNPGCACVGNDCAPHDGHCTGCLPQQATHGLLDNGCSQRLRDFLGDREGLGEEGRESHGLPWVWDRLEMAKRSLGTGRRGSAGSGPLDREAQRLVAVLALRDEIRDFLGSTTADLAERAGLKGPPDLRLTTDYASRHVGPDRVIVFRCATWLLAHAQALESGQGIGDPDEAAHAVRGTWDQAAALMSRAHALVPWRPAPTRAKGIPCWCGYFTIHDHGGGDIKCWTCGRMFTPQLFDYLAKAAVAHYTKALVRG